jgi:NADPH:quinone reductase-like Zn-dependent oxidoreductase
MASGPKNIQHLLHAGWDLVGAVDRLGKGVSGIELGQIIAALPVSGAYAEFVSLSQCELVPVPLGWTPPRLSASW